jgi:signal transduction histidine kinase
MNAEPVPSATSQGRTSVLVPAYIALYVALDWISFIQPAGSATTLGITPWNPAAGLSLAALLFRGLPFAPAVFIAAMLASLLFHGWAAPFATVTIAALIAAGYTAGALFLRRLHFSLTLESNRDLLKLLATALVVTMIVAAAVTGTLTLAGLVAIEDASSVFLHFWVGDMIGIAVLTPFLLLLGDAWRFAPERLPSPIEVALQLAAVAAGLWIIFGIESVDHFEYAYVLFLPLIWVALRAGLAGASWGILTTQIGLIVAIQLKGFDADIMTQFQLLMLAVAFSGLLLGSVVDERRRAEASLRDSEARLQSVLNTAPDGILTFEETGIITSANPAAKRMFFGGNAPPPDTHVQTLLPGLRIDETEGGNELIAHRLDGTPFVSEVAIGRTPGGQRDLSVCVVRDVSERKRAEAWLKEHEAALAHATRLNATGEMAAALAHELNQPLTALIGFARACQGLLQSDLDANARATATDLIDKAVRQALRAGEIIRSTREFIGRGDTHFTRVEISQIFREVLDLVRAEAGLRKVNFVVRFDKNTPPVFADAIQIEQVIINLVRNSMEAMNRSDQTVREIALSASVDPEQPGFLEICVRDIGPGFPPEIADRLFEPFATTKSTGMGLGLAISRSIVESHGGQIRAVPSAKGAEIRFTVPLYTDGGRDA